MKKISLLIIILSFLTFIPEAWCRHSMALSAFGGGNFQLTDTYPDLGTGGGGGIGFEYRFNQHWGLETTLSVYDHDGEGASRGDNGMLFLSVPTAALKFYMRGTEGKFDPYIGMGLGINILTGGSRSDNSGGAGIGARIAVGSDFYFTDQFSLGLSAQFNTTALIRDNSQSSALIFLTTIGNFTFHFK